MPITRIHDEIVIEGELTVEDVRELLCVDRAMRRAAHEDQAHYRKCATKPCGPAAINAKIALAELEHVAQLGLPDSTQVTLSVGFLRPRLAAIRAALDP